MTLDEALASYYGGARDTTNLALLQDAAAAGLLLLDPATGQFYPAPGADPSQDIGSYDGTNYNSNVDLSAYVNGALPVTGSPAYTPGYVPTMSGPGVTPVPTTPAMQQMINAGQAPVQPLPANFWTAPQAPATAGAPGAPMDPVFNAQGFPVPAPLNSAPMAPIFGGVTPPPAGGGVNPYPTSAQTQARYPSAPDEYAGTLMEAFPYDFAFGAGDVFADPSYNFRLQEGQKAIERSGAARGMTLSGRTLKELTRYGQGFASTEYGGAYNRARGEYENAYNRFENDQAKRFNRLASIAGIGQTAAGQLSGAAGNYGNAASGIAMGSGQYGADLATQGGNAAASGIIGGANAVNQAIGSTNNALQNYFLMQQLRQGA